MKKIIKHDGARRVFIYDDGSESPIDSDRGSISLPKTKKKKSSIAELEAELSQIEESLKKLG